VTVSGLVAAATAATAATAAAPPPQLQVTAEPTSGRLSDLHQLDHLLSVPSHPLRPDPVTLLGQNKTQGPTIFFCSIYFYFSVFDFFPFGASKSTTLHSLFSALWVVIFLLLLSLVLDNKEALQG
jgi:hypothetical protein